LFAFFPLSHYMFNLCLCVSNGFFPFHNRHYFYMSLWEGWVNDYRQALSFCFWLIDIEVIKKGDNFFKLAPRVLMLSMPSFYFVDAPHKGVHVQFSNLICLSIYPRLHLHLKLELFFCKCFEFEFELRFVFWV